MYQLLHILINAAANLTDPIMIIGILLVGIFSKTASQTAVAGAIWALVASVILAKLSSAQQLTVSGNQIAGLFVAALVGSFVVWGLKQVVMKARA